MKKAITTIHIEPIKVNNSDKHRLPKKGVRIIPSLQKDVVKKLLAENILPEKSNPQSRFCVKIIVYNGSDDKLGCGDLDNYSKAILDIITKTNRVWKDDKQVDELNIIRKYNKTNSSIKVIIREQ